MTHSSAPGGKPSVSSRLLNFLEATQDMVGDSLPVHRVDDEFDRLIHRENLRIVRFVWIRELDLALFVLTNRRIISQPLSAFVALALAPDDELANYLISDSGVHWPNLDIDLSLRGLLMNEVIKTVAVA